MKVGKQLWEAEYIFKINVGEILSSVIKQDLTGTYVQKTQATSIPVRS